MAGSYAEAKLFEVEAVVGGGFPLKEDPEEVELREAVLRRLLDSEDGFGLLLKAGVEDLEVEPELEI